MSTVDMASSEEASAQALRKKVIQGELRLLMPLFLKNAGDFMLGWSAVAETPYSKTMVGLAV